MNDADAKVSYRLEGAVALVRLNDPATMNALTAAMVQALRDAVARAGREARCLLIAGDARAFSSGANLAGGAGVMPGAPDFDAGLVLETDINPLMLELRDCAVPWITAVRGAAAGVGCSLALAADMVVAGETAYFLQAFRRIGLVPDGGSTHLLVRAAGRVRAMEMMLRGEKLPAATARDWGLVNRVVPDDQVEAAAMALAQELAAGPTRALALTRRIAWGAVDGDYETALKMERDAQREAGRTADFAEGLAAFLGKRPARFAGR